MKKFLLMLCTVVICVTSCFSLIACGNTAKYPTITFMDGETQIAVVSSEEALKAELDKEQSKVGNKFLGFFLDKECTQPFDINNMPEGDFNLYIGWQPLEGYNKVSVSVEATLGVSTLLEADATVMYRETAEGIDFVIDAKADLGETVYNAKLFYVGGTFIMGTSQGEQNISFKKKEIGTIKDLFEGFIEDPESKIIYDIITDVLAKEGITSIDTLKQSLLLPANLNIDKPIDITEIAQKVIGFVVENAETPIYDLIVNAMVAEVPSEGKEAAIKEIKGKVDSFLTTLFNDDIKVGEFLTAIFGDLDKFKTTVDGLQEKYGVKTQDVADLIAGLLGMQLPPVQDGQSIIDYTLTTFNAMLKVEDVLEVKVVDLVKSLTKKEFSLATYLPMVKGVIEGTTIKTIIDMVAPLFETDADTILGMLQLISIEKLNFSVAIKSNAIGLLTDFDLKTNDIIKVFSSDVNFDADLEVDCGYGLYGEDIFALPEIAA